MNNSLRFVFVLRLFSFSFVENILHTFVTINHVYILGSIFIIVNIKDLDCEVWPKKIISGFVSPFDQLCYKRFPNNCVPIQLYLTVKYEWILTCYCKKGEAGPTNVNSLYLVYVIIIFYTNQKLKT